MGMQAQKREILMRFSHYSSQFALKKTYRDKKRPWIHYKCELLQLVDAQQHDEKI